MNIKNGFKNIKNKLLDILFPDNIKCIFCSSELLDGDINETCHECYKQLPFIYNACSRCGSSMPENFTGTCINCKNNNFAFERAVSPFNFTEPIPQLIHTVKFSNKTFPIKAMARYMAERFATTPWQIDLVTHVPIHKNRKKVRGFDQAELLAKEFSAILDLSYSPTCEKTIDTPPLAKMDYSKRKDALQNAYFVTSEGKKNIKDKIVLLIDDVFTTGATCNAVSNELIKNGAKCVYVLTFAHSIIN